MKTFKLRSKILETTGRFLTPTVCGFLTVDFQASYLSGFEKDMIIVLGAFYKYNRTLKEGNLFLRFRMELAEAKNPRAGG
jgi:hypothetical protein